MIIKIVKSERTRNGVKLYAKVPSNTYWQKFHYVVYVRTSQMKRWLCSCPDQIFRQTGKRRNCQHIHAVRKKVGL